MAGKEIDLGFSERKLGEKCAVFGIASESTPQIARLTAQALLTLQHRGQESSGIVTSDGKKIYQHRRKGLVSQVFDDQDLSFSFDRLPGHISTGHNRYGTSSKRSSDKHIQPVIDRPRSPRLTLAHNGNLPDTDKLEEFLDSKGVDTSGLNDSELMHATILHFKNQGARLEEAVEAAVPHFVGAFSILVMDKEHIVAARDRNGIRPFSIGSLNGGYVFSSETCAFDQIGANYIRDVKPGEIVSTDGRRLFSRQFASPNQKLDIFEFIYFAKPDSVILDRSVYIVRENLGRNLAEEEMADGGIVDADLVIPVLDSGEPAAIGYSQVSGIPFRMGFVKNRYIHRTFIKPEQEERRHAVLQKLNPIREVVYGQRAIVVDDSIVRGTTTPEVIRMLRNAGAREVHMRITSPPYRNPEFNGIDTASQNELIAFRKSVEEVCRAIGADSLRYLSLDGMVRATDHPAEMFSMSCFTGDYTFDIGKRRKGIVIEN